MKDSRATEGGIVSPFTYSLPDRKNAMKHTILLTLSLTASLTACSDFESNEHTSPSASPTIEASQDYAFFEDGASGVAVRDDALVMDLEEFGLSVYEVDSPQQVEANPAWVGYDSKISLERLKDLDMDSQLWYELFNHRDLSIGYVGTAPVNLLQMSSEIGHRVVSFQESSEVIYESELVKGVIQAMEKEVEYLYIPMLNTDIPDLVLKAIDLAKVEEISVPKAKP